jgi:hypothetical protein
MISAVGTSSSLPSRSTVALGGARSALVDGRADHRIANFLGHWHRFTREHGFIDQGRTFQHETVVIRPGNKIPVGAFQYRATKVGADTALAQIVKLVQEAQNSKAPSQLLADRAAQWLVLAAVAVGLLTFAVWYWWIGQTLLFALSLTITVFVIACPDALGLATPIRNLGHRCLLLPTIENRVCVSANP